MGIKLDSAVGNYKWELARWVLNHYEFDGNIYKCTGG